MSIIQARGVSLARGGRPVLDGIDVTIEPGQVVGVLGRNGAGKSTLLETLLGFHTRFEGVVRLWGRDVLAIDTPEKQRIAFIPQRDELLEGFTGRDQARLIAGFYPQWDESLLERLCTEWTLPMDRDVRGWSPGQRQRLAIALGLAVQPTLMVLDEPVASLDPLARSVFLRELVTLSALPERAVVLSSHIVTDLQGLVNQVWILDRGRMRWQGSVDALRKTSGDAGGSDGTLERAFRRLVE